MLPPSALVWRHLPELRFLQFPWRWLLALDLAFAFFAAAATAVGRRGQLVWWLTVAMAISATGLTIAGDTSWDSEDVPAVLEDIRTGGYEGIEGFQPLSANLDELDDESPLVGEFDSESGDVNVPEKAEIEIKQWSAERKIFEAKSDEPLTLAPKLLNYPAWEVQVDGNNETAGTASQTGQILVPLKAGSHHIELQFRRTRDRTVGIVISALSIVCLLIPASFTLRRFRKRLRNSTSRAA